MTTLSLNSDYDIHLDEKGVIATYSDIRAYGDVIKSRIATMKGETVFYPEEGIDYFNSIFASYANISNWKSEVVKAVMAFSFVLSIDSFDVSFNSTTKNLSYKLEITTDKGSVTVQS